MIPLCWAQRDGAAEAAATIASEMECKREINYKRINGYKQVFMRNSVWFMNRLYFSAFKWLSIE